MAANKILILGAKGMLGSILTSRLKKNPTFQVYTHSQTSSADYAADLSVYSQVRELFVKAQADYCINAMALTDVSLSENDKALAYKLNVAPAQNLAKVILAEGLKTKLIQISTDHMYDQNNATEHDVKIVNHYALTKYVADEILQIADSAVLRTNFFGASISGKKSFSDWILESLSKGQKLQGFNDVYFSPLHIETLCQEIERVALNFQAGIYNLGSHEGFSKFDFMVQLAKHKKFSIEAITSVEYVKAQIPIPRPRDMRMNISKYEKTFGVRLPRLIEEIQKC